MLAQFLTTLQNVANAIYGVFAWPGNFLISLAGMYTPGFAGWLGVDAGQAPILATFLLSLLSWFLLFVLLTVCFGFLRNIGRILGAYVRIGWFRVCLYLQQKKTMLVLRFRERFPRLRSGGIDAAETAEFDKLDMAVLHSALAIGAGFALSAPDLAGRFKLRPSQVQRSLEKLVENKMLTLVIGSTDGFDNYRITDSGSTYMAFWQRQNA